MIIVLKNADFSQSNIGTLSTWRISCSLGAGATYEGPTSVDKDAALSATVTLAEGYEIGAAGITITMGGIVLGQGSYWYNDSANTRILIEIPSVTGNVLIKVPTINTAGGDEPEEPDTPSITLDTIVYEGKSYRDIFIKSNLAPQINNNKMTTYAGKTFTDSTGTTTIISNATPSLNYVPPYSLYITGTSSQQAKESTLYGNNSYFFVGANINVTQYTKGKAGVIIGNVGAYSEKLTTGFERVTFFEAVAGKNNALYIGSASSANLTAYINNPVIVPASIFKTRPTKDQLDEWYNTYNDLLIAGQK